MKKYLKLLIFILICILIYLIYQNKEEKEIVYTSLGDGFSQGINSFGEKNYGYSDFINDKLKENELLYESYLDFSTKDMTINELKNMILINSYDSKQNNIRQVLRESDLLTISIGINDLIYQINVNNINTDYQKEKILTEIVEKLDKTIHEIKKYYTKTIYIVGYYNFYPQNTVEKTILDRLNSRYKNYCKKNNMIFVDNNNINDVLGKYLDNPDSFYPNIDGYEEISKNILSEMLKKEKTLEKIKNS